MAKLVQIYVEGVSQEQLDDAVDNLQDQIDALGGNSILAPTVVDGDTTHAPTGEAVFEAIKVVQNDVDTHEARVDNPHSVTAAQIGAEQSANKGQANGYVPLNSSSQIPQQYLPSFVDDVLEFANLAAFPATGETGKIYVAIDTGRQYRWSGSAYVVITNGFIASTDDVPEGSTNKYSTNNRVLNYVLTGLTAAGSRVLPIATDTLITAWGKVLKYLTDLGTAAFLNTGTGASDVIIGNDARLSDSRYRKIYNYVNVDSTHTGNTTETVIASLKFTAGDVGVNDVITIDASVFAVGTAGTRTFRLYFHTSNIAVGSTNLTGANAFAIVTLPTTTIHSGFLREIMMKGGAALNTVMANTNASSDLGQYTSARVSLNRNFAVDQYLIITAQHTNGADTAGLDGCHIYLNKP